MRRLTARTSLTACTVLLMTLPGLAGAQVPRNVPLQPGEQWVRLFNGKDLTSWVEVGKEKWTVEDGAMHGQGVTSAYGYLRTEKRYKDFWLSLRFKCEADGNSGIYFHTDFKPGTVDVSSGMQFEIDRTLNHHTGGLYGDGRGWIAWPAPEYEQVIRPTDWNEILVKVERNHMVAILNGIEYSISRIRLRSRRTDTSRCNCTQVVSATCASKTSTCGICPSDKQGHHGTIRLSISSPTPETRPPTLSSLRAPNSSRGSGR